jgi:hypothetical protein
MGGDSSQFTVRGSLFVTGRQRTRNATPECNAASNNCELQTANGELRTLELTARYHVDNLDPIVVLYALGSESIASDRFTVALN